MDVVVDRLPHRAGIDPFLILIDKNRDDNLVVVRGERWASADRFNRPFSECVSPFS